MTHEELVDRVVASAHDPEGEPLPREIVESVVVTTTSVLNDPGTDLRQVLPTVRRLDLMP
jgi:hypothetical protein